MLVRVREVQCFFSLQLAYEQSRLLLSNLDKVTMIRKPYCSVCTTMVISFTFPNSNPAIGSPLPADIIRKKACQSCYVVASKKIRDPSLRGSL